LAGVPQLGLGTTESRTAGRSVFFDRAIRPKPQEFDVKKRVYFYGIFSDENLIFANFY
jgi:hypothetical protein